MSFHLQSSFKVELVSFGVQIFGEIMSQSSGVSLHQARDLSVNLFEACL